MTKHHMHPFKIRLKREGGMYVLKGGDTTQTFGSLSEAFSHIIIIPNFAR